MIPEFNTEDRFPFIMKTIFKTRLGECRIYQTPKDLDLSIGVDWTMNPALFHIHVLFWEIDFQFNGD